MRDKGWQNEVRVTKDEMIFQKKEKFKKNITKKNLKNKIEI